MWTLVMVTLLETGVPKAIELDNYKSEAACTEAAVTYSKDFKDYNKLICLQPATKNIKK